LLTAGIGLLMLKEWARKAVHRLTAIYAHRVWPGWNGAELSVFITRPLVERASQAHGPEAAGAIGGAIGGSMGGCFGMVYPIILLIFMLRPAVAAAFRPASTPPPMPRCDGSGATALAGRFGGRTPRRPTRHDDANLRRRLSSRDISKNSTCRENGWNNWERAASRRQRQSQKNKRIKFCCTPSAVYVLDKSCLARKSPIRALPSPWRVVASITGKQG